MEECIVWFASSSLKSLLSSFLLPILPPVGKTSSSTWLRAETQASASTLISFPTSNRSITRSYPLHRIPITQLSPFLCLHCHSPCSGHRLSWPGKPQQPSNWYPYLQSCPFPIHSPSPGSLQSDATSYSNDLHCWGNDVQRFFVVFL